MQELRAGVLKPSFVLVRDRQLRSIVLAIRGTHRCGARCRPAGGLGWAGKG